VPSDRADVSDLGSDIDVEEFRRVGHRALDWMADYLARVGDLPVLPDVRPGDLRAALPAHAPEQPESLDAALDDFERLIVPAITHGNHPGFFAYFANTGSGPGIVGEMLTAALNVNAMVWKSSPAATELEEHVLAWVRELLGLPEDFDGVINEGASASSLHALAAAREAVLPEAARAGLRAAPAGRIYASDQAHSSIDKAVMTLGFGRDGIRRVASDERFAIRPDALRRAIEHDRNAGIRPVAVVATIGTTSSTAVDPVEEIADIAAEAGAWLHVDAAYAGPAAILPEMRPLFRGWERGDSIVVNPHKWLFTPLDCSILYCRRPEDLRRAFSLTPEYLRTAEGEAGATNFMDYGITLGRRFRALKLWMVMRAFGAEGIRSRLRDHIAMASELAGWIEREPGWTLVAPAPFSTVAFRWSPHGTDGESLDAANERIMDRVNATGEAFLSHTRLGERITIRLAIGNLRTTSERVRRTWELLRQAAAEERG
jgi:aromatic-L-amino-acid decarboxylase